MELQHVNVKLLVKKSESLDLESLIPVLHGWIRDKVFGELLLDVADYRHVHDGPGVVLIGHQGDYAIDQTDGRLGVRYNRKSAFDGSNRDRLGQATHAALDACQRLESEPSLKSALRFDGQNVELSINDRLLAPNNAATRKEADPEFRNFFNDLFEGPGYSLSWNEDPRRLLTASVKAARAHSTAELLANLAK